MIRILASRICLQESPSLNLKSLFSFGLAKLPRTVLVVFQEATTQDPRVFPESMLASYDYDLYYQYYRIVMIMV
jgi:hypothetical protein